jgi:hypothetical protein
MHLLSTRASADERANAGLGCAVTGVVWDTLKRGDGREKDNRAGIANERECLLTREKAAHAVVEILFRRVNERLSIDIIRVRNEDVDFAFLLVNSCVKSIKITSVLHVALDRGHALSDQSSGHVERVLPTANNVDKRSFLSEALRYRQSEAAAAPVITANLPSKLHITSSPDLSAPHRGHDRVNAVRFAGERRNRRRAQAHRRYVAFGGVPLY